jgi:hypothetical protein
MKRRYIWLLLVLPGLALLLFVLSASRAGTHIEGCAEACATAGQVRGGVLRVMLV